MGEKGKERVSIVGADAGDEMHILMKQQGNINTVIFIGFSYWKQMTGYAD